MTTERIALTISPTEERCHRCDDIIKGEPLFSADDFGEPFCTQACLNIYDANRMEADYENICSPRD